MSHLWKLLSDWADAQTFRPTQTQLATAFGVTKGTISNWKAGAQPRPEHVERIVSVTRMDRNLVLTAILRDQGYLREQEFDDGAPMTTAADDAATVKPFPARPGLPVSGEQP